MPTFPIEPRRLPQGDPNRFPQNEGYQPFSWNVGYSGSPSPRPYEPRTPSITVPTWYPPAVAYDDGRLDASSLGDQGWRNQPHQAMDFGGDGGSMWESLGEPMVEVPTATPMPFQTPSFEWNGSDNPAAPVGEPIVETPTDTNPAPFGPDRPLFEDISNRDITPTGDNEWTTSPEDRRFLPTAGPDIRSFGNNLTLGEFLNTPLSTMRYGEGYPVESGSVQTEGTGTNWNSARQQWEQLNPDTGNFEPVAGPDPFSDVQDGIAVEPEVRPATAADDTSEEGAAPAGSSGRAPTGRPTISQIVSANPGLNNPASIRALQRGASVGDLIGHSQFDSHAQNLMTMGFIAQHDPTNFTRTTTDVGNNQFTTGLWRADGDGAFTRIGERVGRNDMSPEQSAALRAWRDLVTQAQGRTPAARSQWQSQYGSLFPGRGGSPRTAPTTPTPPEDAG